MITARRQFLEKDESMMYQGETFGIIDMIPQSKEQAKEEKEALSLSCSALPETMANTILDMVGEAQVYSLEEEFVTLGLSDKKRETTTTTTSTTSTPTPTNDKEQIMKDMIKSMCEQYDMNGRHVEHPIPAEFLPPLPELSNGEPWQNGVVSEEEFNKVMESMNLPPLPEGNYESMAAPHVPQKLVEMSIAYISYMYMKNTPSKKNQAVLSDTALQFYEQFGIYAEDKNGLLVNWKTVFYVTHLLRTLSTGEAYQIEEDLFSGTQGMSEYNLDNWHATRTHAIRMVVIAHLSGENVEAVTTLDLLMRFRRSMQRASHSITFHKIDDKAPLNQSLCFVNFLNDENKARACWMSIGLTNKVAKTVPRIAPYYDGTYCKTCIKHHVSLLYCTTCYCTQYCSLSCLKKDKRLHEEFCKHNAVKK